MFKNLTLQFKLAFMFFIVMFVSASISISVMIVIFGPIMRDNAEQQLKSISASINELDEKSKFTSEEILELTTNSAYKVTKLDENTPEYNQYKPDVDNEGLVIVTDGVIPNGRAYLNIGDDYFCIDNFSNQNVYWVVNLIIIVSFMACILLGTVITGFVGKTILQPIRDMNKATTEIAKGNFKVQVKVPSDREYGMLAANFNKMAKELAGTETLRGDFISNVSHEFKTPLASIQGFAKLLQDKSINEEERDEYTQIIIDETTRLSKLSSNILRLTKLENQTTIGKKARFSLDEQIRKIILMLEHEWNKKNITLDIELEDIYYVGNEDLMGQIWQNIINNAIKFTPINGEIIVQLYRSEKNIICKISDNGPSIPTEVIVHIFDKFYQGDRSRATEGNGLGLALVKRIVDLCDGKVYVENLSCGGCCFNVELPYIIEDMMK